MPESRSARSLGGAGPAPSTVLKELRKNMYHQQNSVADLRRGFRLSRRVEPLHRAQLRADKKASRPKTAKLAGNPRLRTEVEARLKPNHSPEQISGRLMIEFADDPEMRVSHEPSTNPCMCRDEVR